MMDWTYSVRPEELPVLEWIWWILTNLLIAAAGLALLAVALFAAAHYYYRMKFLDQVVRIFEEKPLFIVPRGKPLPEAEEVLLRTPDGLMLRGCYLPTTATIRQGVILFGLEFGSNRWAVGQYCLELRDAGYDIFTFEPRNQGESDHDPAYQPLQWVCDKDLVDLRTAIDYLKRRPDAPTQGIGLFGISKGGSVGLALAAEDPWIRCLVTDGAYAAYTTMVPYMRRWVQIYSPYRKLQDLLPSWFYGSIGVVGISRSAARRGVRYLNLERCMRRLRQPLLMIHGAADAYIKPEMAEALFRKARSRMKELWIVPGAKHNQSLHVAGEAYVRRLVGFFHTHLASLSEKSRDSGDSPSGQNLAPAPGAVGAVNGVAVITRKG